MTDTSRTHESFGMLSIHRTSRGVPAPLFGSSISCANTIVLKVLAAEEHRDLNRTWYFPKKALVEVEMSPVQFAEAITSLNTTGIPCTVRYVSGTKIEDPPTVSVHEVFNDELTQDIRGIMATADTMMADAINILNAPGTTTKGAKQKLVSVIQKLKREIESNLPFIHGQFTKQMNRSVAEAKGELDAHVTHMVSTLGQEALQKMAVPSLPEK